MSNCHDDSWENKISKLFLVLFFYPFNYEAGGSGARRRALQLPGRMAGLWHCLHYPPVQVCEGLVEWPLSKASQENCHIRLLVRRPLLLPRLIFHLRGVLFSVECHRGALGERRTLSFDNSQWLWNQQMEYISGDLFIMAALFFHCFVGNTWFLF